MPAVKHWKETAGIFGRPARSSGAGKPTALATVMRIPVGSIGGGRLEGDVRKIAVQPEHHRRRRGTAHAV